MITIGELAWRGNVTVKALRHYDRLGLLKPVWIDRFNGYRYYNESQVNQLQRIQALKEMGFALRQILPILEDHISLNELRSMLAQKREELSVRIQVEQARLSTVEARLKELENSSTMGFPAQLTKKENIEMKPEIVSLPAFYVVGTRYVGKNKNNEITRMWDQELLRRCDEIQPKIQPEVMYGVCDLVEGEEGFEYVGGSQVPQDAEVPAGMAKKFIPANKYAVFYHLGPASKISHTMDLVYSTWLAENSLERAAGPDFEYYNEEFDPGAGADCKTYIYVPVR